MRAPRSPSAGSPSPRRVGVQARDDGSPIVMCRFEGGLYLSGIRRPGSGTGWPTRPPTPVRPPPRGDLKADFPAVATSITDPPELRRVLATFVDEFNARRDPTGPWPPADLDQHRLAARSPSPSRPLPAGGEAERSMPSAVPSGRPPWPERPRSSRCCLRGRWRGPHGASAPAGRQLAPVAFRLERRRGRAAVRPGRRRLSVSTRRSVRSNGSGSAAIQFVSTTK